MLPNKRRSPLRCLWVPMGFALSSVPIEAVHTPVLCSVCLELASREEGAPLAPGLGPQRQVLAERPAEQTV
jgi:hypothetical protein